MTGAGDDAGGARSGERSADDLLDLVPDAVIVLTEGPTLAWLNHAAEALTGLRREDVSGRPAGDVLDLKDVQGRDAASMAPLGRKVPLVKGLPERDFELRDTDGVHIPVSMRCTYEKDADAVVRRVVCSMRDARPRRGMDMRTVELISTVSHEIRSPLTSIKGFTKTLLDRFDRFDDTLKKEMLAAANSDADRVTRLLGELLDISRLEAGRLKLRPKRFDLTELVRKVAEKQRAGTDEHRIEVELPESVDVFADPDKIEQVLTNLLENAVKYTDGGSVRVGGRVGTDDVVVEVSDEGEGIPTSQLPRLFRKFYRRERAGSPSGTGLGLYICKGLIEAHGGDIDVISEAGVGTTFRVRLPKKAAIV